MAMEMKFGGGQMVRLGWSGMGMWGMEIVGSVV